MTTTPAAQPARVAVMGSGSWGTAFALVLSDAGNQVTIHSDDLMAVAGQPSRAAVRSMADQLARLGLVVEVSGPDGPVAVGLPAPEVPVTDAQTAAMCPVGF